MSNNEFQAKVDEIAARQGWHEGSILELCLLFLGAENEAVQKAFLTYLEEIADEENEEIGRFEDMDGDHAIALARAATWPHEWPYVGGYDDHGDF